MRIKPVLAAPFGVIKDTVRILFGYGNAANGDLAEQNNEPTASAL